MADPDETDDGISDSKIAQASRVVEDPSMKGSIAYYGSMLLLAMVGRIDLLAIVLPDLEEAMRLASENIRKP